MVALFGCVWAVIATAVCVGAVVTRRSVLAWMKARKARLSGDDTVEIVRPGLRKVALYAALVVLALPAGVMAGGTALPGPSAQGSVGLPLTGGTITGQLVSSGVTCDFSTATNENWSVCPAGTGQIDFQAPIQNSVGTTIDIREALTTGKTDACNGVTGTEGEFCIVPAAGEGLTLSNASGNIYQRIWASSAGSAFVQLFPNGAANQAYIATYTSGAVQAMQIGSAGTDATVDDDIEDTNFRLAIAGPIRDLDYNNTAAASELYGLGTDVGASASAIGHRRLLVKGGGLVALGVEAQALTCADNGGGLGTLAVDPTSSTVIITNNDVAGGCTATIDDATVSGTVNALGARVTICSSPQSQNTAIFFADVANKFNGGTSHSATGLFPGDCFSMIYADATDDLWLATTSVVDN